MNSQSNDKKIIIELNDLNDIKKKLNELKSNFRKILNQLELFQKMKGYDELRKDVKCNIIECIYMCKKEVDFVEYQFNTKSPRNLIKNISQHASDVDRTDSLITRADIQFNQPINPEWLRQIILDRTID